jgi:hypothetical protein
MAQNTAGQTLTLNSSEVSPGFAEGKLVFDGTAITAADYVEIQVGFKPKYVKFNNITDRICVEFYAGMTADNCLKTAAAGTRTLETTNQGITLTDRGFRVSQNATLAVIAASKTCQFIALS